jgi:malonyl-CoA/methylmalonyl-CoA synthetase
MLESSPSFPPLHSANQQTALRGANGSLSYAALEDRILRLASGLLGREKDLREQRIAIFMEAGFDYVTSLLGIWRAGGIAVPLNVHAALPELEHALATADVKQLLVSGDRHHQVHGLAGLCLRLGIAMVTVESHLDSGLSPMPLLDGDRRAMMLFTSGTTSKPKGVVTSHRNIRAQITTLVKAWHWRSSDRIPLFLPLHHIHGIINVLCCALWSGASVSLFPKFEAEYVRRGVAARDWNVFMAVPTIYVKILQYVSALSEAERNSISAGFSAMRLMVSGSAACPVQLFEDWRAFTGQSLLERYGMTETGMTISNPYAGERRAGAVGQALPGVDVVLFDEDDSRILDDHVPGEIRIRGDNVFKEYWRNPEATAAAFRDGWFCTGDTAENDRGYFRILGRSSIDIIKSGGYKLSALEIESVLLAHEAIAECAVIGIADETWGEAVCACVVLRDGASLDQDSLKNWCRDQMSPYKIPRRFFVLEALPRNAMGKVTKPALAEMIDKALN